MRTLLNLMSENAVAALRISATCQQVLRLASKHLNILDPDIGEKELVKSVADHLAKLQSGGRIREEDTTRRVKKTTRAESGGRIREEEAASAPSASAESSPHPFQDPPQGGADPGSGQAPFDQVLQLWIFLVQEHSDPVDWMLRQSLHQFPQNFAVIYFAVGYCRNISIGYSGYCRNI